MNIIHRLFTYIEQTPLSFKRWCLSFLAILVIRFFIESALGGFTGKGITEFIGSLLHSIILFFLLSYLVLLALVTYLTQENFKKVANFLLFGSFVMIFPPIIDKILLFDNYWSFYILDSAGNLAIRFLTFFGENPRVGITYGTRIEVFITIIAIGLYVYVKTKKLFKTIIGMVGTYVVLFVLGTLPSYIAYIIAFFEKIPYKSLSSSKIAGIFLSPLYTFALPAKNMEEAIHYKMAFIIIPTVMLVLIGLQYMIDKRKLWALIRNVRFPQTIFNGGLLLVGMGVGWIYFPQNVTFDFFSIFLVINLLIAVLSAWFFSVFINDIEDRRIDVITNVDRPLVKEIFTEQEYYDYSYVFLALSLVASLIVGPKFFLLVMLYHFLTFIYSCYPFRLKRFVGIASLLSSFASLIFFMMGYILLSENQSMINFPWRIASLLLVGYALAIPLKDIKDIEGDRQDGVYTLPVLVGEPPARLILGALVLGCYFYAVYALNERVLFLPSLICGSISFWIITNNKIKPKAVSSLVLMVAAFYVIILTAILTLQLAK